MLLLALGQMDARPSDLFTQSFLLCLGDRGPLVHARRGDRPPAFGGAGGESFEAAARLAPTLPRCAVPMATLAPPHQPKLLQQLGLEQRTSPRSPSPGLLHAKNIRQHSFSAASSPHLAPPPRGLFAPQNSVQGVGLGEMEVQCAGRV